jgi:predicted nucleic acid-binding protein
MTISYFDSSVLLAILLDEERQEEACGYWQDTIRVSSILLKIETIITLRRVYENNKQKLKNDWLKEKIKVMDEYLSKVNYKILDTKIEKEIYLRKELAKCRALDAIHVATALQFKELNNNEEINFYTFDKTMHELAKYYKFRTNEI